ARHRERLIGLLAKAIRLPTQGGRSPGEQHLADGCRHLGIGVRGCRLLGHRRAQVRLDEDRRALRHEIFPTARMHTLPDGITNVTALRAAKHHTAFLSTHRSIPPRASRAKASAAAPPALIAVPPRASCGWLRPCRATRGENSV